MNQALKKEITNLNIKLNDMLSKLRKTRRNTSASQPQMQPTQPIQPIPAPALPVLPEQAPSGRVKRMVRNIEGNIQRHR